MIAWTSPAFTLRSIPFRISLSSALTCRFLISSMCVLSNRTLEAHAQQFLRFDRELHRQLAEDFLAEAADDHVDGVFRRQAALPAVENLVLADLRRRRFVFHLRRGVADFEIREGVRAALVADEQRVALRVVARARRVLADADEAAIGVLAVAGGDPLRDDRAPGVLPDVDHLGAGVGLLPVVGRRHRVELADRAVPLQDAARILPRDRGARLDLRPGDLRAPPGGE